MEFLKFLHEGLGQIDAALLVNRVVVGAFFILSGYHKLFVPARHAALVKTLQECRIPFVGFNQWFVPLVEFFGGMAVMSGLLAPLAALGMIAILIVAIATDGPKRLKAYMPIDAGDYLCDVLYLQEVLYLIMLVVVILGGPGTFSLYPYVHLFF
jgi:uncharacterized membrane protein YphA (DoxX/SURF4 family)